MGYVKKFILARALFLPYFSYIILYRLLGYEP